MNAIDTLKLQRIEELLSVLLTVIKQNQYPKTSLGIMTQKELLQQLNVAPNTLKSWENKGLKRLEPPIEGTRTIYYKLSDVLHFLSQ